MLKFVKTKGQTPEKSSVDERVKNFSEIYKNYIVFYLLPSPTFQKGLSSHRGKF